MTTEAATTCQICARPIKAKTGLIAHHGYRRPMHGSGWQTSSCMGARSLPYEVACDVLPLAINSIKAHIEATTAAWKSLVAAPPETLVVQPKRFTWGPDPAPRTYLRPEGFDPASDLHANWPGTYEEAFANRRRALASDIKASQDTLAFFVQRLAAWVAPAQQVQA